MKLYELYNFICNKLSFKKFTLNYIDNVFFLFACHIFKCSRIDLRFKFLNNTSLSCSKIMIFKKYLHEFLLGKPIQYILKKCYFYNSYFYVDKRCFIPRQETEEMVNWVIIDNCNNKNKYNKNYNILDICTGSACIAITLSQQFPYSNIYAYDISHEALEIALINKFKNKSNILLKQLDIINNIDVYSSDLYFDIIVSNPPYILINEIQALKKSVYNYEPHTSLFTYQHNPLIFYEHIGYFAKKYLTNNGLLYIEINPLLYKEICFLFKKLGYNNIAVKKDYQNHNRVMKISI